MNCTLRTGRLLALVVVLSLGARGSLAGEADARQAALRSITSDEIKQLVGALADDTFEGRESGSRGGRAAGTYIVDRLKKASVAPGGGKDGFYQPFGNSRNILAFFEGRDPALKQQVIVISAHYDHVGYGSARNSYGPIGNIHNGADDNASGVAALVEVAEALTLLPQRPRRSILVAFWDGEEKGLLGSKHWSEHPTVPLAQVPIMINADMVGRLRGNKLEVLGVRTSTGLRRLVSSQNEPSELWLDFNWEIKPDSDHHTFYSRSIPFLMFHTGLHPDYHRPSDDPERINNEGLARVAQLMFNVVVELAEAPEIPGFRNKSQQEDRGDQRAIEVALPAAPGRLGIRWDETAEANGVLRVVAVTPGSAAANGGLRVGDTLLTFAGAKVESASQLRLAVLTASNPVTATVERGGLAEPVELTLQLPGEPVRLGVTWRTDDAEPSAVILNRVLPGSPADNAGLLVNDRIQLVDGQPFVDGEDFKRLVATRKGHVAMEVESNGQVRTVDVLLPSLTADATTP